LNIVADELFDFQQKGPMELDLNSELIRADSWSKLRNIMEKRSLSTDMWTSMENGIRYYTQKPLKLDPGNIPAEPPSPFGTAFYTARNRFKFVFRAQSQIGWDNCLKGKMSHDWITCIYHHFKKLGAN
jgi:hypothetical protein